MTDLQPKVAIVDSFLQAFASIPRSQQRAVMNFVSKFRENPRSPGINYEVIRNARDKNFRSVRMGRDYRGIVLRSEEHTSELQSRFDLVCRLLLETKKNKTTSLYSTHE